MNQLKNLASSMGGNQQPQQQPAAGTQQEDYLDKGMKQLHKHYTLVHLDPRSLTK
jgi:hypothetical protein